MQGWPVGKGGVDTPGAAALYSEAWAAPPAKSLAHRSLASMAVGLSRRRLPASSSLVSTCSGMGWKRCRDSLGGSAAIRSSLSSWWEGEGKRNDG